VRVWTKDFADWIDTRTQLAMKIRDGLAEAGIEVPRPQREVLLRTLPPEASPPAPPSAAAPGSAAPG
jgi:small-conductance mechanosensitive channel